MKFNSRSGNTQLMNPFDFAFPIARYYVETKESDLSQIINKLKERKLIPYYFHWFETKKSFIISFCSSECSKFFDLFSKEIEVTQIFTEEEVINNKIIHIIKGEKTADDFKRIFGNLGCRSVKEFGNNYFITCSEQIFDMAKQEFPDHFKEKCYVENSGYEISVTLPLDTPLGQDLFLYFESFGRMYRFIIDNSSDFPILSIVYERRKDALKVFEECHNRDVFECQQSVIVKLEFLNDEKMGMIKENQPAILCGIVQKDDTIDKIKGIYNDVQFISNKFKEEKEERFFGKKVSLMAQANVFSSIVCGLNQKCVFARSVGELNFDLITKELPFIVVKSLPICCTVVIDNVPKQYQRSEEIRNYFSPKLGIFVDYFYGPKAGSKGKKYGFITFYDKSMANYYVEKYNEKPGRYGGMILKIQDFK